MKNKILILIGLLISTNLIAAEVYDLDDQYSTNGKVQVEKYKGDYIIHYPKESKVRRHDFPVDSVYLQGGMCETYVRSKIEEINAIEDAARKQEMIRRDLYDERSPLMFNATYFPYYDSKYLSSLREKLENRGVQVRNRKYKLSPVAVTSLKIDASSGFYTNLLDVKQSEAFQWTVSMTNSRVDVSVAFLPLACDLINKQAKVSVVWSLEAEPQKPELVETFSKPQVVNTYYAVKESQNIIGQLSLTNSASKAFVQGMIIGNHYQDNIKEVTRDNVKQFLKLSEMFFNHDFTKIKNLDGRGLDDIYFNMMDDISTSKSFSGVSYVE